MKLQICFLGLLCLYFKVDAQQVKQSAHPLDVGMTVPDILLTNIINYSAPSVRISDFKGKVLILDFWATWCTSCLYHFPDLNSLQHQFGDKVQILLVNTKDTRDNKAKISAVMDRFKTKVTAGFSLPTVYGDTVLNSLFTHYQLPHVVWIDAGGVVRAVTSGDEVTKNNLQLFIDRSQTPAYQKRDFDPHRPLYTDAALPLDDLQQYSILLKGKSDGIGQGGLRRINDTVRGLIAHNQSLLWIFRLILDDKIPGLNDNRLVVEVKDPSKLYYTKQSGTKLQWERQNDFSYELVVPKDQVSHLYDYALSDLNRYTGYYATIENRKEDCWILARRASAKKPVDTTASYVNDLENATDAKLSGSTLFNLCLYIDKIAGGNAIVIDETGIKQNVNIHFGQALKDISTLQSLLPRYGLRLYREKRTIPMMVIRDNSISNPN